MSWKLRGAKDEEKENLKVLVCLLIVSLLGSNVAMAKEISALPEGTFVTEYGERNVRRTDVGDDVYTLITDIYKSDEAIKDLTMEGLYLVLNAAVPNLGILQVKLLIFLNIIRFIDRWIARFGCEDMNMEIRMS